MVPGIISVFLLNFNLNLTTSFGQGNSLLYQVWFLVSIQEQLKCVLIWLLRLLIVAVLFYFVHSVYYTSFAKNASFYHFVWNQSLTNSVVCTYFVHTDSVIPPWWVLVAPLPSLLIPAFEGFILCDLHKNICLCLAALCLYCDSRGIGALTSIGHG